MKRENILSRFYKIVRARLLNGINVKQTGITAKSSSPLYLSDSSGDSSIFLFNICRITCVFWFMKY